MTTLIQIDDTPDNCCPSCDNNSVYDCTFLNDNDEKIYPQICLICGYGISGFLGHDQDGILAEMREMIELNIDKHWRAMYDNLTKEQLIQIVGHFNTSLELIAAELNTAIINEFGDQYEWEPSDNPQLPNPNWNRVARMREEANSSLYYVHNSLDEIKSTSNESSFSK